ARADAELRIGVREMDLDRVDGHEQLAGDLLVGQPLRGELRDPSLCLRQTSGRLGPAGAHTRQLRPRFFDPTGSAELAEDRRRSLEALAGRAPLPQAALGATEDEERPRLVEAKPERVVGRCSRPGAVLVEADERLAALCAREAPRVCLLARQLRQP